MWNLKINKTKLTDTENRQGYQRRGQVKWVKGVKQHKVPVMK